MTDPAGYEARHGTAAGAGDLDPCDIARLRLAVSWVAVVGAVILVVNWVQCVIFETGAQRQRVATDAVTLVLAVVGFAVLARVRAELAPRPADDPA